MKTALVITLLCLVLTTAGCPEHVHTHGIALSQEDIVGLEFKAYNGDAEAALYLSIYYGVELHDQTLEEKWLRVAATLKHPRAQRTLAYLIKSFKYSPQPFGQDPPTAVLNLLEQSAQTDGNACGELASAYAEGYFGKPDPVKARVYFLRGSKLNYRMCWEPLSDSYRQRLGGPVNYTEAYYWISLESRCTDHRSISGKQVWAKKEEIATRLTIEQLETEWRRIDAFTSKVYSRTILVNFEPFLEGAIDSKLSKEGRTLSNEEEDKHRSRLRSKRASISDKIS